MKKLSFRDVDCSLPKKVFNFKSIKNIKCEDELIGQQRAIEALDFGLSIRAKGYNIFVTGPTGTGRRTSVKQMLEKKPEEVIKKAVWGMIPKNKLGRAIYKKLKVYRGPDHPHQAQKPEEYRF